MSRFFFDIHNGGCLQRDEVGDEFEDFAEARDQAQALLPDIAREELPDGDLHEMMCELRDESGRIVYRARLTLRGEVVDEVI